MTGEEYTKDGPCPICGGVTTCPGDPPEGARSIDLDREHRRFYRDGVPDGWTEIHWKKRYAFALKPLPGWKILVCGTNTSGRRHQHGWPEHYWVGMCRYACAVPAGEGEDGKVEIENAWW